MITTLKKNKYIQAFFINMFLGLICFGYFIVKNDGLFILSDDFNFQQIPFIFSYLHHAEQLSCADQRQAQNRHIEHSSAAADRKQRHKDEHDAA